MRKKIAKLYNNKFIQGGVLLTAVSFITNLLSYLFYSIAGKAVGPVGYGEIVTMFSYLGILGIPPTIVTTIIIRRLGMAGIYRDVVAVQFAAWFTKNIKKWWLLSVPYFAFAFLIPKLTNLYFSSGVTLLLMLSLGMLGAVYGAILQGGHFFVILSLTTLITALFKVGGATMSLLGFGGLEVIYIGLILGVVGGIIPAVLKIKSLKSTVVKSNYVLNKKIRTIVLTKSNFVTLLSLLGIAALGSIDIMLVKKLFTAHESGLYGAWSLFSKTVLYVLGPISTLLLIFFSAKETQKDQEKIMGVLLIGIFFFGVITYIGYTTLGHILVSVILNSDFGSIEPFLGRASIFGITYATVTILNNYFIAKKSKLCLLTFITIPIYILMLLVFGKTMSNFISINVMFTSALTAIYLLAFIGSKAGFKIR